MVVGVYLIKGVSDSAPLRSKALVSQDVKAQWLRINKTCLEPIRLDQTKKDVIRVVSIGGVGIILLLSVPILFNFIFK